MRIEEIKWDAGSGLNEFRIWGIESFRALACAIINEIDFGGDIDLDRKSRIRLFATMIEETAERSAEAIDRFFTEMDKTEK